jgi:hypothetical protein
MSKLSDETIRDADLIGMFADAIKLDGLRTVLGCLCDGILLADIRLNKESVRPADFQDMQRQITIARFLLLEALERFKAHIDAQLPVDRSDPGPLR